MSQKAWAHGIYASAVWPINQEMREFQNDLFRLFFCLFIFLSNSYCSDLFHLLVATLGCQESHSDSFWLQNPHLEYPVPRLVYIVSRFSRARGVKFPSPLSPTLLSVKLLPVTIYSVFLQKSALRQCRGTASVSDLWREIPGSVILIQLILVFSQKSSGYYLLDSEGRSFI